MKLKKVSDIPTNWKRLTVRKKTSVKIRECKVVEQFMVSWSDKPLTSDPTVDLIIIQSNGREYPIKKDIFRDTYVILDPPGFYDEDYSKTIYDYEYIKNSTTTIVEIPEGVEPFEIETLEGVSNNVAYPDYVAIGPQGELYSNTAEFVKNNLEILEQ